MRAYNALVFNANPLTIYRFRRSTCGFDPFQEHVLPKYRHREFPDFSWLSNVTEEGFTDVFRNVNATIWHSDGSHMQDPPELGILGAYEVASRGGATLFVDMYNAFEMLNIDMQSRIAGLNGLHRHGSGPGGSKYKNALDDDQQANAVDTVHLAMAVNPSTGQHLLYLNETHTRRFRHLEPKESVILLQNLIVHATPPEIVYVQNWKVGITLIWDQRFTNHRRAGNVPPDERRIKICSIVEEFD